MEVEAIVVPTSVQSAQSGGSGCMGILGAILLVIFLFWLFFGWLPGAGMGQSTQGVAACYPGAGMGQSTQGVAACYSSDGPNQYGTNVSSSPPPHIAQEGASIPVNPRKKVSSLTEDAEPDTEDQDCLQSNLNTMYRSLAHGSPQGGLFNSRMPAWKL